MQKIANITCLKLREKATNFDIKYFKKRITAKEKYFDIFAKDLVSATKIVT